MSYDDWKLATPPTNEEPELFECFSCKKDFAKLIEIEIQCEEIEKVNVCNKCNKEFYGTA